MELAEVLIIASLNRKESRGSFSRDDYPTRDDENYLYHSMVTKENGELKLDKSEVDISLYEPAERKY
jgi:succinate dehydrogenase/fumarate reductase flavoprotein subunit